MSLPSTAAILQVLVTLALLLVAAKPLGWWISSVLQGRATPFARLLRPIERGLLRAAGVDPASSMSWRLYGASVLVFSAAGLLLVYGLQRVQGILPGNPTSLPAVPPDLALNTAVSFVTNTNWQSYGGETTLGWLVQMAGLTVQNFVSAATGVAVMAALARGVGTRLGSGVGNFWVDLVRITVHILLPLSLVLALLLACQGVPQTFRGTTAAAQLPGTTAAAQVQTPPPQIPLGPVASQVAIKQLGTNGGGYFNVNSAHPLENPTPLSNFLQCLAILLIPAALCWTWGDMVADRRQGWALLAAMMVVLVVLAAVCIGAEQAGNPRLTALGVDQQASLLQPGGNMEGKEVRIGPAASAFWATATTAASNGSVDAMHDSFTPLGGLIPMWLMQLGEVIFGGVGSGLYGMILFVLVAVFVAGLMVGRTPEYLGKKIEPFEMKMACIGILSPCALVLIGTAVTCLLPAGTDGTSNPGPHGFSQILYAFSSASNNNGSAFAGLSANVPYMNVALAVCMFLGRFMVIIPVLAIAGSLVRKNATPPSLGTLPTHTPLFVAMLLAVVVIVGALTFVPALALGPVAEQMAMQGASS